MNKIACQYAIIRFAPFVETGEFANVGVLLIAPQQRFFGFLLETKRYGRITQFFNELDAKVYRNALLNVKSEMERVRELLSCHRRVKQFVENDTDLINVLFKEITRTREAIIRFSSIKTVLTEDPNEKLEEIFQFYVERNFVDKQYQEKIMEKNVKGWLTTAKLAEKFVKQKIGDSTYQASFPFVELVNDRKPKVIKPLHLSQDDSSRIYDHGAQWVIRIKKLKSRFLEADNVLFALSSPEEKGARWEAYREVENELLDIGVRVAKIEEKEDILNFAMH